MDFHCIRRPRGKSTRNCASLSYTSLHGVINCQILNCPGCHCRVTAKPHTNDMQFFHTSCLINYFQGKPLFNSSENISQATIIIFACGCVVVFVWLCDRAGCVIGVVVGCGFCSCHFAVFSVPAARNSISLLRMLVFIPWNSAKSLARVLISLSVKVSILHKSASLDDPFLCAGPNTDFRTLFQPVG